MRNLRIIFFALTLLLPVLAASQQLTDKDLIRQQDFTDPGFKKREVSFLMSGRKNKFVKYNPATLIFGSLLYVYQEKISQQLSSSCPYQVSCSNFGHRVISEYGLFKGVFLTADRLLRCNPLATSGLPDSRLDPDDMIIDNPEQYHFHPE